jgi:hypothetical protein
MLSQKYVDKIIFSPDGYREDKDYGIDTKQRTKIIEIFFQELTSLGLNMIFDDYFLKSEKSTTTMEVEKYYTKKL